MRCPTCRREVSDADKRYAPFCSERCKLIDLGKWLDGDYRIPGEPAPIPEEIPDEEEDR